MPLVVQELYVYPSGSSEFVPVFSGVLAALSLVFYVVLCRPFLFHLPIAWSVVFRITVSDYLFGIFKHIMQHWIGVEERVIHTQIFTNLINICLI